MTLSRRALIIILPIILISNILIAFSVYWIERKSIEQAEAARLSRQMEALFAKDRDFTRNLAYLMQAGDAIRSFVRETDENFRTTAIGGKVQDGIEFFSKTSNRFVSFAVLQSDQTVDYYFEKSDDPFATIGTVQLEPAKQLMQGAALQSDDLVQDEEGPLLIHSELLDRTTFSKPLATQKESSVTIQSTVRPQDFVEMKAELEKEYGDAPSAPGNNVDSWLPGSEFWIDRTPSLPDPPHGHGPDFETGSSGDRRAFRAAAESRSNKE